MITNLSATLHKLEQSDPIQNLLWLVQAQHEPVFWGIDSEFLMSGRINEPSDVHSIQFSDGTPQNTFFIDSADALKQWLYNHHRIKVLYGFVVLPDLGSMEEWLGKNCVSYRKRGSQTVGRIKYRSFDAAVYDTHPLLQGFGIRKLADAGDLINYPKLDKPEFLGKRRWENEAEYKQFVDYANSDAIITSRIVQWLYNNFNADPQRHASAGTLARDAFDLPKRLSQQKKTVILSPLEAIVKANCYAGRSEGFRVGYMPNSIYNDVASLYPCSLSVTHALEIVGVRPCNPSELSLDGLDTLDYGWMLGTFESKNDYWGIPLRGRNNFYATGTITGFFHTFDLMASKAKIKFISQAYKPVFQSSLLHSNFVKQTLDRVEGRLKGTDKMYAKAVLNSLTGKLGQSHPISTRSNFYAYSTVLAHSHAIMSQLFDRCTTEKLAMDTDSIFSYNNMAGKWLELDEGEYSIPIIISVVARGNLSFFRSKNYIMKTEDGFAVGRQGWVYFVEDFKKLHDGTLTELLTRQDIKHTLLTRTREALKMAKGRWRTKPVVLTLEKIKELLQADPKRERTTRDSYGLVMEHKSSPSHAWQYEDLLLTSDNPVGYPRSDR
jgi:hypothetical protein